MANPQTSNQPLDSSQTYQNTRRAHWDSIAKKMDGWRGWGGAYRARLRQVFGYLVPTGQRVLEVGCGRGDLLAALQPAYGVGVDFSSEMVCRAQAKHPDLIFVQADAHQLDLGETFFDTIILSDLVNDLWDVQAVLTQLQPYCHAGTRLVVNYYNRLWQLPLGIAQRLGLAKPNLQQNWLADKDIHNLLYLAGFEAVRSWPEMLFPFTVPLLTGFFNRFVLRFWPFNLLALTTFTVARPLSELHPRIDEPIVTVVVPARNEAGNVPAIFARVPEMGGGTELIFVEGNSTDDTYAAIEQTIAAHPDRRVSLYKQPGIGKADAVQVGFKQATGEILMILDADLTVPPEDLPMFYEALRSGKGEFINGVRLVYPMEKQAMRFLNLLGNKFFSVLFSWMLGQTIRDTLCGTKVLWKQDYEHIAANRVYFGDFDPFGDYDLIFGAAKLNLKIVDLPIRYRERTYGDTNIDRWRHGALLLRMVAFAARRLKFI